MPDGINETDGLLDGIFETVGADVGDLEVEGIIDGAML